MADPKPLAHLVLDRLNTAIVICDRQLNVIMMNPSAEMMFGVSARQAGDKPLSGLAPEDAETLISPVQKALSSNQPVKAHDVTLVLPGDRCIHVDYTVTPMGDGNGNMLLIELFQVDGFFNMTREQNRMNQHDANRDVLRGLAHEVKNPLGGLRGAAQLLQEELSDRGNKEYTRIIIHEADRLRNLVDRMMGPYTPAERGAINIHEVLEHVRKLIQVEIQEGINIDRDYDPSLPGTRGSKDQLIQAVLNLMRNSIEAMEQNGTIKLRTRIQRSVYIGQKWHRGVIKVDIEDDGCGIPEHMQERIFYPMVTGRADGSGLGLSIAQDIINKHNGLIRLFSEPGHTRFSLLLPFNSE